MAKKTSNPVPAPPPPPLQGAELQQATAASPAAAQKQTISISETYAGPLPDPGTLADYDKALPGLAERIVVMAEEEQRARLAAIGGETKNRHFDIRAGRIFSFIFSLAVCGVGLAAIYKGYPNGGTIIISLHVAGVIAQWMHDRLKR